MSSMTVMELVEMIVQPAQEMEPVHHQIIALVNLDSMVRVVKCTTVTVYNIIPQTFV